MAFEETLVCDGCSRVVDGGGRGRMMESLRAQGGRAFGRYRRGELVEAADDESWPGTTRHLCGRCADSTVFYDGEPVPAPLTEDEENR